MVVGAMMAALEHRQTCARGGLAARRRLVGYFVGAALACGIPHATPAAAQTAPIAAAKLQARYEPSTKFASVRDMLQRHKVLEKAQRFMSPLRLPRTLTIRSAECGAPSLPYDADKGIITICYEAIASMQDLAKGSASDPDKLAAVVAGGVIEEALHRMALAILQVFDVPVWGKEDDAADLLGAFLMLQFDERTARVAILGAGSLFLTKTSSIGKVDYASDVSPPAQRFYNFLCIAFGGDTLAFGAVVEQGFLPKDRAGRCKGEYDAIRKAFDLRLMPFVDPDLVVKVRATDWLSEKND
jgi:hypothetical protein